MFSSGIYLLLSVSINVIIAQYNTQPPYDRDRTDQPYDRDRQNPQYDRDRPYDRPYDRNHQYDRNPPYGGGTQPYDRNNQPYDRNNPPYDRNYNQSQYGRHNYSQYGPPYDREPYNRDQYYTGNRSQYDRNRDPYNRDQYDRNRDQYHTNKDPYDRNRDPYNRDPYDRNRDYDRNREQYGNRDPYGQRDPYNRDDYSQYGQPLNGNDDCCQDYCYSKEEQPYSNFATKTAYQIVFGKGSNQHRIPDCSPIQFWSINRQGTRFPSFESINRLRQLNKIHSEIIKNYDDKRSFPDRGRLCPEDLDLFRRWRWNETVNERNADSLTSQGIMDMKYLARRYSTRFEELMREPYSENTYSFQYTESDKTHDSYQAFIEGLFKEKAYQVHANVFNNDRLIQPTKTCNAWIREVKENPQTLYEYMKFKHKQEYQQMVRDVFRRLGFRYTLNDSIIDDMYDLCRYEKAWNLGQPSPWCMVFNKEQLKLLEYAEDLKYYYKAGYGNKLNHLVGCPPLKDLYEKFERTVNNGGNSVDNKVTVFFTHSITIQTFLTAMGIANDQLPLTADNYFQQNRRQWRTSLIDPFAANLAAVLYQCRSTEKFRVMFFLNEVPVNYPDCSVGLCNWSTVQNKLRRIAENCNLEFCDHNVGNHIKNNFILFVLVAILINFKFC